MEYLVPQPTFYKSKALCVCVRARNVYPLNGFLDSLLIRCWRLFALFVKTCFVCLALLVNAFGKTGPLLSFLKILLKNNSRNKNHQSLTCLIYTTKVIFSIKVHVDRHYFNRKIEIRNYCFVEKKKSFPIMLKQIDVE